MCYTTKRKIADCVKVLMRRKDISKITIQDIMDATNMSRQSFYYHFKDIYDVLEWIALDDFKDQLEWGNYDSIEEWGCDLMKVLRRERVFYEKLANELDWPLIIRAIKNPIKDQIQGFLMKENPTLFEEYSEEMEAWVEFLGTSICYYMIDYAYRRKKITDEHVERDIRFMMRMVRGVETEKKISFPEIVAV